MSSNRREKRGEWLWVSEVCLPFLINGEDMRSEMNYELGPLMSRREDERKIVLAFIQNELTSKFLQVCVEAGV